MKLSATLASLGIPSYFVHPSEAVHGDLGRYHPHDIALFVSNSGETSEILRIIPAVKGRGCVIISLTADANSSLGRASDIVLTIGRVEESAPLGIAPTTSTTVLLALGDALSMAVASRHGITRQSYAQFHPGGDIGRNLMTVREIMRTGEEHCIVRETLTAREVLRQYISTPGRPGAATVVDDAGVLVGIFTDGDLRRRLYEGIEFLEEQVASVMGRSPKTVRPSQLAREALNLLVTYEIDQVIVVDDHHRPVGLVDIQDLARIFG
jgi:arabinose-5-phosphate isomerase